MMDRASEGKDGPIDIYLPATAASTVYFATAGLPLYACFAAITSAILFLEQEYSWSLALYVLGMALPLPFLLRGRLDGWAHGSFVALFGTAGLAALAGAILFLPDAYAVRSDDAVLAFWLFAFGTFIGFGVTVPSIRVMLSDSRILGLHPLKLAERVAAFVAANRRKLPLVHAPRDPHRTALYGLLIVATTLGFVGLAIGIVALGGRPRGGLPLLYIWVIAWLAYRLRRFYAWSADKVLEHDRRAPVLFLRSFVDDNVRVTAKGLFRKFRRRTIEEAIAPIAREIGPFVTIAKPGERLPRLGAAKASYADDTWQDAIERWIGIARLIVMVAGRTEWVKWELERIAALDAMTKLIILVPPDRSGHRGERQQWLEHFFAGTRYENEVSQLDLRHVLALVFRRDGVLVIHKGLWRKFIAPPPTTLVDAWKTGWRRGREIGGTIGRSKREIDFVVAFNTALYATLPR